MADDDLLPGDLVRIVSPVGPTGRLAVFVGPAWESGEMSCIYETGGGDGRVREIWRRYLIKDAVGDGS